MQWSPDRNAGFSDANPQRLYSPVIIDSEYLFETVNVETQQKNPSSLLWWMKRLIALRQHYVALRKGSLELLAPENSAGLHLKALARISRLFKNPRFRESILQAVTGTDIYELISQEDAKA